MNTIRNEIISRIHFFVWLPVGRWSDSVFVWVWVHLVILLKFVFHSKRIWVCFAYQLVIGCCLRRFRSRQPTETEEMTNKAQKTSTNRKAQSFSFSFLHVEWGGKKNILKLLRCDSSRCKYVNTNYVRSHVIGILNTTKWKPNRMQVFKWFQFIKWGVCSVVARLRHAVTQLQHGASSASKQFW